MPYINPRFTYLLTYINYVCLCVLLVRFVQTCSCTIEHNSTVIVSCKELDDLH